MYTDWRLRYLGGQGDATGVYLGQEGCMSMRTGLVVAVVGVASLLGAGAGAWAGAQIPRWTAAAGVCGALRQRFRLPRPGDLWRCADGGDRDPCERRMGRSATRVQTAECPTGSATASRAATGGAVATVGWAHRLLSDGGRGSCEDDTDGGNRRSRPPVVVGGHEGHDAEPAAPVLRGRMTPPVTFPPVPAIVPCE